MDELGRVVLSHDMRDALAMHEGDVLAVSREDNRIILQKNGRRLLYRRPLLVILLC